MLSYTNVTYDPLTIEPIDGAFEKGLRVTTVLKNTGARDGEEVAELFLTPPAFEGAPRLSLRGFQRIAVKAGESRSITFALSPRDLSFVTADGLRQILPGQYTVSVGSGQPETGASHQSAIITAATALKLPE